MSCFWSAELLFLILKSCTLSGLKYLKRFTVYLLTKTVNKAEGCLTFNHYATAPKKKKKEKNGPRALTGPRHQSRHSTEGQRVMSMSSITCDVMYSAGLWSPLSLPPKSACLSHALSERQFWATPATLTRKPAGGRWGPARGKGGMHDNVSCLSACECLWWGGEAYGHFSTFLCAHIVPLSNGNLVF